MVEAEENFGFATPRDVRELTDCYFYHTMDVPGFGVQKGHWDLRGRFHDYIGGVDVTGKSVLDIGTASGFLSFAAEAHGASRVVSFDMSDVRQQAFVPFKGKQYTEDYEGWIRDYQKRIDKWKNAYWLCHQRLSSKAEVFYGNVYHLPSDLGEFDITIVGSVLEHLVDPVSALISISRLTRKRLILITPMINSDDKIARFEPSSDRPDDDFTWWTYSTALYRELLAILGFEIEKISAAEFYHEYAGRMEQRSTLVAVRG